MKHIIQFNLFAALLFVWSCSPSGQADSELAPEYPQSFEISASNNASQSRSVGIVTLAVADLKARHPSFNPNAFVVLEGENELASQAIDSDSDGEAEAIVFLADFEPNATKNLTVRFAESGDKTRDYSQRAQAELSHKVGGEWQGDKYVGGEFQNVKASGVRDWHTDHTEYFRYEGPGWESDKVGYRFYLDWRNAIDVFGKKTPEMVLQNVGLDGYDSYHEMAGWGMDVLSVGASLGIGSIGFWHGNKAQRVDRTDSVWCEIVANGPIYAQIRTEYIGWQAGEHKVDLVSNLSISAGSRMTRHTLEITGDLPNLCTGIAKKQGVEYFRSESSNGSEWQYIAHYGKQSLAGDDIGLAVLYRQSDVIEVTEDSLSHVVVFQPSNGKVEYRFLAAWEKEPGGITSKQQFVQYLEETVARLNAPIKVEL